MKFLTFGEIMLRLKAPGHECFFQSPMLEATFGGGEANVAVSPGKLRLGRGLSDGSAANDMATSACKELRRFGVDTKRILRGEGPHGHLLT